MSRPDRLPKVLTEEEQAALLDRFNTRYWTPHRNRTMCLAMLDAGLRVGEMVALKLEHVDLATRRITVREGKGAKDRRVPVIDRLAEAVSGWYERRAEEVGEDCPWVFPTRTGNPVHPNNVRRFVKREARRAGIAEADRVSPHTLRHTFATDVLNETGNLELVRRLLGHADISTTQMYLHLADSDVEEALQGFRAEEGQGVAA